MTREELLQGFVAKAGCRYTQRQARALWGQLEPHLTKGQNLHLWIAWNHHGIGEGREELDEMAVRIRSEWES